MLVTHRELDNWLKVGRGKGIEYFITEGELMHILRENLVNKFEPYYIVVPIMESVNGLYIQKYKTITLTELEYVFEERVWHFFIGSEVISPNLQNFLGSEVVKCCSFNGLIHVQSGIKRKGKITNSCISYIDKIRNTLTGEVRENKEYGEVFNLIKKHLSKLLVYETFFTLKDGQIYRSEHILMSEKVKELIDQCKVEYSAIPGKKIK